MRLSKLIVTVITGLAVFNSFAAEPVMEPHAMLYYQVTFGNGHGHPLKKTFGFRLDDALVEPGKPINYQKLFRRPAVINLKMDDAGVWALNITGVNFLKQVRALHANEDDANTSAGGTGAKTEPAGTATGGGAAASGQAGTPEKKGLLSKLPDYSDAIKRSQYLGLAAGIMLGIGILMGIGG